MAKTIPLIRAANVLPIVRFLEVNGRDAQSFLDAADLGYWFALSPLDPIPLLNGIGLLHEVARSFGPDVGARIVSQGTIGELAFIGQVALGARTPVEALRRVATAIPLHSSHEQIRVLLENGGVTLKHQLTVRVDPAALHAIHVMFCALMQQVCMMTGSPLPCIVEIAAPPHPEVGLNVFESLSRARVIAGPEQSLAITFDPLIVNRPFLLSARDRSLRPGPARISPLSKETKLAASMTPVIAAMLHGSEPSIERVARSAGLSVRTLQRRLAAEGTTFATQLDRVRRDLALSLLAEETISLADLADRLGYASGSTLSRAVRRLVGDGPTQVRSKGTGIPGNNGA